MKSLASQYIFVILLLETRSNEKLFGLNIGHFLGQKKLSGFKAKLLN